LNRAEGVLRGNRCRRAKVQAQGPRLHGSPIPAKSGRRSSENDPLREEGAKRSQKGKRPPRRKAPENTRAAVRGALPVFPGKKAPPFRMERRSFRSNRPFPAVRPAERAGKQSPLPIKPSFRGNAYIFSRSRKNTGRCGRCAPFSVSVFASAFPRRISG